MLVAWRNEKILLSKEIKILILMQENIRVQVKHDF